MKPENPPKIDSKMICGMYGIVKIQRILGNPAILQVKSIITSCYYIVGGNNKRQSNRE
jgi:hypothetical protein